MDASSQREFLRIDQALKEKGQRGHVHLPPTGPLIITTAEGTRGRSAIIGPRPTRDAIRVALRTKELGRWAEDLKVKARGGPRVPPVIWNTRHLVVTGVTSSHALLTALRRPNEYDESDLEQLGAAAECSGRELEAAFAETTTESLPTAARRWMRPDRGGGRMSGHAPLGASEPTGRPERRRESILTRLAEEVRADPDGDGWLRILMRGIARTWPHLEEAERREALEGGAPSERDGVGRTAGGRDGTHRVADGVPQAGVGRRRRPLQRAAAQLRGIREGERYLLGARSLPAARRARGPQRPRLAGRGEWSLGPG